MTVSAHLKHVLITGGTGSVGQSLTRAFRSEGYNVVFQYHTNQNRAEELALSCGAESWKLDFSQDFELPRAEFDILVNNAAINTCDELTAKVPTAAWRKTLAVNLDAPFRIIHACLPWMVQRNWGRIINISSIYGLKATEGNLPYTVSKHGLSGLTKTVAREYGQHGITCNEICPGPIESELMDRIAASETTGTTRKPQEYFADLRDEIPSKRLAEPKEVASVALFLASSDSGYMNGASLTLDGGMIA